MKELQSIIRLMTRIDAAYLNEGELNPVRDKLESANFTLQEIRKVILKTVYPCDEMLLHCIWKGVIKECKDLFQLRPTDEGLCCVFNSAVYKNLYKNNRRSRNVERSESHGLNLGLTVILDSNLDDYALTTSRYNGFKILVGHSEEFPDPGKRGFLAGPGMELYTAITPAITSTEPRVESADLPLEKLMCRFNSFKLKWLPTYTSASCLLECETEAMMKICGCRPFYYPVMIRRLEIQCGCEDACDNIIYHVELSHAVFPGYGFYNGGFLESIKNIGNASSDKLEKFSNRTYNSENLSRLHFFYKDAYVIHYIRDLRLAWEDFIALQMVESGKTTLSSQFVQGPETPTNFHRPSTSRSTKFAKALDPPGSPKESVSSMFISITINGWSTRTRYGLQSSQWSGAHILLYRQMVQ
ncbi:sodium channel protein Nach-like isoform X2 [Artemia franciscana]|uniref:sodium channel protein Nach-like isoform X2 n=1 Tax=Artemia franciscana TaxID=6661 RepID=UPI0032DBEA0D